MRFLLCKVCFWFQRRISEPLPRGKIISISLLYFQKLNFFVCLFIHLCIFERFWVTFYGRQSWCWKRMEWRLFPSFLKPLVAWENQTYFCRCNHFAYWHWEQSNEWRTLRVGHHSILVARVMKASRLVTAPLVATGHFPC